MGVVLHPTTNQSREGPQPRIGALKDDLEMTTKVLGKGFQP